MFAPPLPHAPVLFSRLQASKEDAKQPSIADVLPPLDVHAAALDVCVVGCGPAGLALAAELGALGVNVGLVGAPPPAFSGATSVAHITLHCFVKLDSVERLLSDMPRICAGRTCISR